MYYSVLVDHNGRDQGAEAESWQDLLDDVLQHWLEETEHVQWMVCIYSEETGEEVCKVVPAGFEQTEGGPRGHAVVVHADGRVERHLVQYICGPEGYERTEVVELD